MAKLPDPAAAFEALEARVLRGSGVSSPAQRQAAGGTGTEGFPREAVPLIEKVRKHAHRVTDEDVAALKAAGLDEDTIFELVIAAAVGAAGRRLDVAMKVIDEAG